MRMRGVLRMRGVWRVCGSAPRVAALAMVPLAWFPPSPLPAPSARAEAVVRVADDDLPGLDIVPDVTICLEADVVVRLRAGISLGGSLPACRPAANQPMPAPPAVPSPPAAPSPAPTQAPSRAPAPSMTPSRAPAPSKAPPPSPARTTSPPPDTPVAPAGPVPPVVPAAPVPPDPRPAPSTSESSRPPTEREPAPSVAAQAPRLREQRAGVLTPRRDGPLATIMVVVVLSLAIALIAGVAFVR